MRGLLHRLRLIFWGLNEAELKMLSQRSLHHHFPNL